MNYEEENWLALLNLLKTNNNVSKHDFLLIILCAMWPLTFNILEDCGNFLLEILHIFCTWIFSMLELCIL